MNSQGVNKRTQEVMDDTGMSEMQAESHLKQRDFILKKLRTEHNEAINKLDHTIFNPVGPTTTGHAGPTMRNK
jgi:hypothetical protein